MAAGRRISVGVVIVFGSGGLMAAAWEMSEGIGQTTCITVGCALLLFLPLLVVERLLTGKLEQATTRLRNEVRSNIELVMQDVQRLQEQSAGAQSAAATAHAGLASMDDRIRKLADDARNYNQGDPGPVKNLLKSALWRATDELGFLAPVRPETPDGTWYMKLYDLFDNEISLYLYLPTGRILVTASWTKAEPLGNAVRALREKVMIDPDRRVAPPSVEAITGAVDEIVSVLGDALVASQQLPTVSKLLASASPRGGWALTRAALVSLSQPKVFPRVSLRSFRALSQVPRDVRREARTTLSVLEKLTK